MTVDLTKYKKQRRTFAKSGRDLRTTCEIISDKPTAIDYLTGFIDHPNNKEIYTAILQNDIPDYFWVNPSSSSGKYHPSDERGKYGLVLHTCRVTKITHELCIAAEIGSGRNDLIVAAIFHDSFKYGVQGGYHTQKDHCIVPGEQLRINDRITELIRTHDGHWVLPDEWANADEHQKLLHYADYIASRSFVHIRIP
ncbi:MAG: hypothetical protein ACTSPB_13660 [Candidatus Thorarchaeota archaeon]